MKKNTLKIICCTFFAIIMFLGINFSYLETYAVPDDQLIKRAEDAAKKSINPYDYKPDSLNDAQNADRLANIGNIVIGTLQIIGSLISVIVLVVLGIKYMVGSVEERAEYKKTMLPYLIGAVMVFGIVNILGIFSEIIGGLF